MIPSAAERRSRGASGPFRFADFVARVQDGQKADLLDGVIYHLASPDNIDAGTLFVWLITLLAEYVDESDLGHIYGSRVAFRLSDTYSPGPDIAFIRKGREAIIKTNFVNGPPDLAIEIVSPDSIERDCEIKRTRRRECANTGSLTRWKRRSIASSGAARLGSSSRRGRKKELWRAMCCLDSTFARNGSGSARSPR